MASRSARPSSSRSMVVLAANVNDGVLLIETAERLRAEGMERIEATQRAAELRLRPRLMITLPVSLGFVLLAFALEPGGELLRPLAVAAIGGLLAAVLVALYLVPVLYTLVARRDDRLKHPSTTSIDNAQGAAHQPSCLRRNECREISAHNKRPHGTQSPSHSTGRAGDAAISP
ncbi:MAG: efflux RND transporter permease subunit [Chromatiales bacterium]|nr:efflux RND transporter permease subunit [Chromatiales bacterium]